LGAERKNLSGFVLAADGMSTHGPENRPAKSVKRAVISAAAAFGFKPVGPKWIAAFTRLEGSFERVGFELAVYVMGIASVGGMVSILSVMAVRQYLHSGWTDTTTFFAILAGCLSLVLYPLVSNVNLRYEFSAGSVRAYNTWRRLLWSEDLTGLKYVTAFSARGSTAMTLVWPHRKRTLILFDSMREPVEASLESAKKSAEQRPIAEIKKDDEPSWTCPYCHENNPGNFEECWKCLKFRPVKAKS
jgi:hypothetical protein